MSFDLTSPRRYPIDAFYLIIRDAINEVWTNTQAPDALIAMEFLTDMAVSAQGIYEVRLPTGQVRPLSLNLLVVAESGERKTRVHNLVAKPLYEFDTSRMKKYKDDLAKYEQEHRIWKSEG
ncbi:TPA: DUF3987 domain-containing protein, partial [Burkholderia cenocepacia]|nr:DUF3987 domain-containing protein [Burkholderia cenocepacia]